MATLRVMSANLRCEVPGTTPGDPDHWGDRLPAVVRMLKDRRPHLLGTQELSFEQLTQLTGALPIGRATGAGREGGSRGEHCAILHDPGRLMLRWWRQVWLSETPDLIGSCSWDSSLPRIATIAGYAMDDVEFALANTHFDHVSELARAQGMRVLLDALPKGPVIVTGDFNCAAECSTPWEVATRAGLHDTWLSAERRGPEVDTFHGYAEPTESQPVRRIDWILASEHWRTLAAEVVTDRPGGVWPSDHWPVLAELEFVPGR
ncbi:endonuclease/exonuclease/phosphatase family protein [Luteococcus sanguinis]|uniref:Endonuclease/exonuclease/phosphatase family protein n=1 Tax=Luteococcus sanguinis TaxID=174038 RepID=A0ABW1X3F6_9ACTN